MNLKLEACRGCPTQCWLEDTGANIAKTFKEAGRSDSARIRGQNLLSDTLGQGIKKGCPQSELAKVKRTTLEVVNPSYALSCSAFAVPVTPARQPTYVLRVAELRTPIER